MKKLSHECSSIVAYLAKIVNARWKVIFYECKHLIAPCHIRVDYHCFCIDKHILNCIFSRNIIQKNIESVFPPPPPPSHSIFGFADLI